MHVFTPTLPDKANWSLAAEHTRQFTSTSDLKRSSRLQSALQPRNSTPLLPSNKIKYDRSNVESSFGYDVQKLIEIAGHDFPSISPTHVF